MNKIFDPPPREPTLEQHMIEFGKSKTDSLLNSVTGPKKYLILQGNRVAQIFIKNAFEFFEKHFPNKNPHTLTSRCLQINVSAVRRFKTGPTEKTICQKPYTKKSKPDDDVPISQEPKNKKSTKSKKNEDKSVVVQENTVPIPSKSSCTQQNVSFQSGKCNNLLEQTSFVSQENREFNPVQAPMFSITSQNIGYQFATSGKNMNYSEHNHIASQDIRRVGNIAILPKPPVPDIFHLSPEPQYGAPSVALATTILNKNTLSDSLQLSTGTFQQIKPFGNQQGGYQFPNVPGNSDDTETKGQDSANLQKQFEASKFNFGNVQSSQNVYKY